MKRLVRLIYPALFLAFTIAVILFFHLFTQVDQTMSYIDWTSSVQIHADGTEEPFVFDTYSNTTELTGTYRFTGKLPEDLPAGDLLFEITGMDLSLSLNGEILCQSGASAVDGTYAMSQVSIPLPKGTSGELVLTCSITDGAQAMFPPLLRFLPEYLTETEVAAMANLVAFPSGAAALALVLVFGLLLLGVRLRRPDFSLIPLFFALAVLIMMQLMRTEGSYFLPQGLTELLSRQGIDFLVPVLLLLYLAMNRNRHFWKYFGIACGWSAGAFLLCYLVSLVRGGYLAFYINDSLLPQIQAGIFGSLCYWISLWLAFTAAAISSYGVMQAIMEQRVREKNLMIKNHLILKSYQELENRMAEDASRRHEWKHQLTALQILSQKNDCEGVRELLTKMLEAPEVQITFTGNHVLNTILQDAAGKAARQNILFRASVQVPEQLGIPEEDLCAFFINMLENALEAARKTESPAEPFVRIYIKTVGLYLAVKCENSFGGEIREDSDGNLLTTKDDAFSHGFGLRLMKDIAEKYQSILKISYTDEKIFTAETALRIPDKK